MALTRPAAGAALLRAPVGMGAPVLELTSSCAETPPAVPPGEVHDLLAGVLDPGRITALGLEPHAARLDANLPCGALTTGTRA